MAGNRPQYRFATVPVSIFKNDPLIVSIVEGEAVKAILRNDATPEQQSTFVNLLMNRICLLNNRSMSEHGNDITNFNEGRRCVAHILQTINHIGAEKWTD